LVLAVRKPDKLRFAWNDREVFELDSQRICAVSKRGLITMKKLAGRMQDLADIEALEGGRQNE
jgi:hypothetical protein